MSDASDIRGAEAALVDYAMNHPEDAAIAMLDAERLKACIEVFAANFERNSELYCVYEGSVPIVNVQVMIPDNYKTLKVGCPWPEIAVQSVVERSQFDGFSFADDETYSQTEHIFKRCNVGLNFQVALTDALIAGVSFVVVGRDEHGACLRWHTAQNAAGIWNHARGRLDCGFAIVDRTRKRNPTTGDEIRDTVPSKIDFYTEQGCWEITLNDGWHAEWLPDSMGEPRMLAVVHRPDGRHPLGRSRFTRPIRAIVQEYMANALNIHVASEYTALGQKWVTGLSEEQFKAFMQKRWNFGADGVVLATDNPNSGSDPKFGNFAQQSMEPILSVKRSLATDFAAATSIPINELLTQDSNPTSAQAITATQSKLISLVASINMRMKPLLEKIAMMLVAIEFDMSLSDLPDEFKSVNANMKDPATPTASAMADAQLKIASTIPGYGSTSVCQKKLGFDEDERRAISNELASARAIDILGKLTTTGGANG